MPENKLNSYYLNNGYFYLTCNACDRLIKAFEMSEEEYDLNAGYCPECFKKQGE